MAYTVETVPAVKAYLRGLSGLSREGRLRLVAGYYDLLANQGDRLRGEPERRLAPGSPCFQFDLLFQDGTSIRRAFFVADDSTAVYGVLRVVYAEVEGG